MASTKYLGYLTAVFWRETGGSFVNVSGASRQFGLQEQANEVDVTTRDDKNEGATAYIADIPARTATLSGLDTTGTRAWKALDIGDTGTLLVYPQGTGASKPYEYADGTVTQAAYNSEQSGPVTWDVQWRITTAITDATTPA